MLDAAGVKPNIRFTTKDDYAIIAMVEQGLGVSIMPELLLRGRGDGVALRPLDPPRQPDAGPGRPRRGAGGARHPALRGVRCGVGKKKQLILILNKTL